MATPYKMSKLREAYLHLKQVEHEAQWVENKEKHLEAAWEDFEKELKGLVSDPTSEA